MPTQSTLSTCIVSVYYVGRQASKGESTMYQQQELWYIHNHGLLTTPARFFTVDFVVVVQLQVWQRQGDRLLIFMDMYKHVLQGPVAHHLSAMGLDKTTHHHFGEKEPHTHIGGTEMFDSAWHTLDLEVSAVLQLSSHEGEGDHSTVLFDAISAQSAITWQEFNSLTAKCVLAGMKNFHLEDFASKTHITQTSPP